MKTYIIKNLGKMYLNITNLLRGAAMAMACCSTYKLSASFANMNTIRFSTNCKNFVSQFTLDLSNYNLKVEEEKQMEEFHFCPVCKTMHDEDMPCEQ